MKSHLKWIIPVTAIPLLLGLCAFSGILYLVTRPTTPFKTIAEKTNPLGPGIALLDILQPIYGDPSVSISFRADKNTPLYYLPIPEGRTSTRVPITFLWSSSGNAIAVIYPSAPDVYVTWNPGAFTTAAGTRSSAGFMPRQRPLTPADWPEFGYASRTDYFASLTPTSATAPAP
jgi:hypothetical protein